MRFRTTLLALALCTAAAAAHAQTITYEHETAPYPGVRILERHTTGPSWRMWVAFTSLCDDGVHVDARSSQSTRITAATWGNAMGAQLAVNGDFYRTDRTEPTVLGDAVGVGLKWPIARTGLATVFSSEWYYRDYGWIAFGKGWVEFTHSGYVKAHAEELDVSQGWRPRTLTTDLPPGTLALVSGFPELVVEGKAMSSFPDRGDASVRHPRTAMGLSKDKKTFILAVVDGRSTASVGMTGAELATLMKELGAYTAFNLDGGGSSQMWLRGSGTINDPSDGQPRPVANHWGIYAGTGHDRGRAPGSCFNAGGCFPSPVPAAASSPYADLPPGNDAYDQLVQVLDGGLLATCADEPTPFACPNCTLTRRDAIGLVARAAGLDLADPPAAPTFSDVPIADPQFAAIEAAAAAGLIEGCGAGTFCPDDAVTRGQLHTAIARARGWSGDAFEALTAHCVTAAGCSDTDACSDSSVERAAAAVIAVQAFDLDGNNACADTDPDPDPDPDPEQPSESGGCAAGGGAAGLGLVLGLLAVLVHRRRRLG
jgi:hypothetical protein